MSPLGFDILYLYDKCQTWTSLCHVRHVLTLLSSFPSTRVIYYITAVVDWLNTTHNICSYISIYYISLYVLLSIVVSVLLLTRVITVSSTPGTYRQPGQGQCMSLPAQPNNGLKVMYNS